MVKIELKFDQLKEAIQKLPVEEKARLVEELEHETWRRQFRALLSRIDSRLKKNPISQKKISEIVEQAREEYHARSRR